MKIPHSNENEITVLSSAIFNKHNLIKVLEYGDYLYYFETNRDSFKILQDLNNLGMDIDFKLFRSTFIDRFPNKDTKEYFVNLAVNHSVVIDSLLDDLHDKYIRRELIKKTSLIAEKTKKNEDIDDLLTEIIEIKDRKHGIVTPYPISDMTQYSLDELNKSTISIKTCLDSLNDVIIGFDEQQLIIVAGETGSGKTTFAWHMLSEMNDSLFITLEMSRRQLYYKILSRYASVDSNKFKTGKLFDDELKRYTDAKEYIKDNTKIEVVDTSLNLNQILNLIRKQHRIKKIKIAAVENLQLIMGGIGDTKTEKLHSITRAFKLLAKELKIPIILLSQQNKGSYNQEPSLADLNNVGADDADLVIFCYDDSLIIAKGREVRIGSIENIDFQREYSRFVSKKVDFKNVFS